MIEPRLIEPEQPRPLKRTEYDALVKLGSFEGERVELIHGSLVATSPQDPNHIDPIDRLNELLVTKLHGRARVRVQGPFAAGDDSEPEPDLAVLPLGDYRTAHPDRAHLIIEVAVSSLQKDRVVKAPLYARSNVTEYWLVDVGAARIEVYREPSPEGYRRIATFGPGDEIGVEAFPGVAIRVSDVL